MQQLGIGFKKYLEYISNTVPSAIVLHIEITIVIVCICIIYTIHWTYLDALDICSHAAHLHQTSIVHYEIYIVHCDCAKCC